MSPLIDVIAGDAPEPVHRPPLLSAAGWSVMTGVITTISGLVASVVIARWLGPLLMGEYSYWMWIVAVLPMFFGFGLPQATLKFAAQLLAGGERDLAASVVRALLKISVAVSVALAAGLLIVCLVWVSSANFTVLLVVAAVIVLGSATGVLGSATQAAMDYRFVSRLALWLNTAQVCALLIVLTMGGGLLGLFLVMLACSVGTLLLQRLWFRRVYGRAHRRMVPPELRAAIIKYCRSITALSLLDAVAWSRSEIFLLRLFAGADQIAFYSLAYGISGRLIMAATLITHPMVPALSGLHALNDSRRMSQIYQAAVRYVALLTFPLALGGIFFADPLVTLIYGARYHGVAVPLVITAVASLAFALTLACSAALYALGRPDFLVRLNVILVAADMMVALLLTPRYGAVGAALANAIAPIATLIVSAAFLQRRYALRFPVWSTTKIFIAAGVAVGLAWSLVPASGLLSFLAIGVITASGYAVAVIVGRIFDQAEDCEVFRKVGERLPRALRGYYDGVVSAFV
jgi:O-antigen/teichoic acid export membrane protein